MRQPSAMRGAISLAIDLFIWLVNVGMLVWTLTDRDTYPWYAVAFPALAVIVLPVLHYRVYRAARRIARTTTVR